MTVRAQEVATSLWMGDRDMVSLHLAREVDGDRTAGNQIRKVLGRYFEVIGDVSDITTYTQAEEWAQALRVEGHFPELKVPNWRDKQNLVVFRIYWSHLLGLAALATNYIQATSPVFSDAVSLYKRHLRARAVGTNMPHHLDTVAWECIDGDRLNNEHSRVMSQFSSAAISGYFDMRSKEDGFVGAMREAADARSALLPPPILPADLRPWEVA